MSTPLYVQDIKITLRFIRLQLRRWLALFSSKFWLKVFHLVRKKIRKKDWKKSQGRLKSLEQFMFYFWWSCSGVDSILRHHSQIHLESKEFQHLLDPYSLLFQDKIINCIKWGESSQWSSSILPMWNSGEFTSGRRAPLYILRIIEFLLCVFKMMLARWSPFVKSETLSQSESELPASIWATI